jgi:hypothetical protein
MLEHVYCLNIADMKMNYCSSPTLVVSVSVGLLFIVCTFSLDLCKTILQSSLSFKRDHDVFS